DGVVPVLDHAGGAVLVVRPPAVEGDDDGAGLVVVVALVDLQDPALDDARRRVVAAHLPGALRHRLHVAGAEDVLAVGRVVADPDGPVADGRAGPARDLVGPGLRAGRSVGTRRPH